MPSPRRWLSRLLFAWFVFVAGAAAYALVQGRRFVPAPNPEDDELDIVTSFSELAFASTAPAFRGGRVTTSFAGGVVDLSGATLADGHATLRLQALFGGGQLIVPAGWRVELRMLAIFGGVGDARGAGEPDDDAPVLTLTGLALFGGWGVTAADA
jgi:hypothetical protein